MATNLKMADAGVNAEADALAALRAVDLNAIVELGAFVARRFTESDISTFPSNKIRGQRYGKGNDCKNRKERLEKEWVQFVGIENQVSL